MPVVVTMPENAGQGGGGRRWTATASGFAWSVRRPRLTRVEMVEGFAGRFRQEDVFRDLKQRLGWEECRAWTQAPIERTSQVQWVTLSLLRLAQFRLEAEGSTDWWLRPPWRDRKEARPSVLDVERLLRRHGSEIRNLLAKWLGKEEEAAREPAAGDVWDAGEGRVAGAARSRDRPLPSEWGEMRGRQPEEAELDMITWDPSIIKHYGGGILGLTVAPGRRSYGNSTHYSFTTA